jgi:hypothetical protein
MAHDLPPSPHHARLDRALARCMGQTPALRAALRELDTDNAKTLAVMLEQLLDDRSRASGSGFTRGFSAGQQF